MTGELLEEVMRLHLLLGASGFHSGPNVEMEQNRTRLLEEPERFATAKEWLSHGAKQRAFQWRLTSYGLKHIAEEDIGYITNGTFGSR